MPASDSTGPREPGLAQTLEALAQAAQPDTASALSDVDLDAYDPGADFKARITLTADGGTEFFFPPMRAAAKATAQTAVFVVSLGLFILADTQTEASLPLLASWGIIELLFFLWILRLWFAPERVVIGNGVVTYTYGLFGKTRTMPTAQVAAIHAVHGSYAIQRDQDKRRGLADVQRRRWNPQSEGRRMAGSADETRCRRQSFC
jgi:hypothetical protein